MRRHHVGTSSTTKRCCGTVVLLTSQRCQFSGNNMASTLSKKAYGHPLAPKNPSQRNIVVPNSVHAKYNAPERRTAEQLQKEAQKALLLQMQQNVLWEGTVIDDAEHELIQHFIKISKNSKYRHSQNLLVVGGKEMIRELCAGGNAPRHLLVTEGKVIPEWAREQDGMEIVRVQRHIADACSPGNDGFVGEFAIPPPPPKEQLIANKQRLERVLVLDNVDDPGVLGTILRTAVGFQYDAIVTTNHCADLYDHRVVRAARGAHFQRGVPIYTLRDEDGDNVYGMLNHVAERNNLMPVCVSGQEDEATTSSSSSSSSAEVESRTFHSSVAGVTVPMPLPARTPRRSTLSDFCLDRFTAHDRPKENGYMLFAGPNHKRTMMKRLSARVSRPTTQLLVDGMPSDCDLLLPLSVAMHALRPAGDWDYLPLAEKHTPSSMALQTKKMSVDIGANRLSVDERDLNLDEEEQVQAANLRNEFRKWKRLRKKQRSDYDFWMQAEEQRVQEMLKNEQRRKATPWDAQETHREKGAAGMPEWVPNIIDEYRQSLDRDRLVEERETSEAFVRPPNYKK